MKKYLLVIPVIILTFYISRMFVIVRRKNSKDTSNDNKQSQNSSKHNHKIPKHIFDKTTKIRRFLRVR